ncbi:MAG: hypothetical protein JW894_14490 [Bacteroidales bacterium]|nr:hypothetical protein [Bacteroidales bacterium]
MKQSIQQRILSYISDFFSPVIQVIRSISQTHFKTAIFVIIPVIFLINAVIVHYHYGVFYQDTVDPEYFHMYNGIAIGGGNLAVEYIVHPATTLEFFMAISARIIHPFQPNDYYIKDFINDPEKYIHSANLFMNIILSIVLFFGGYYSMKRSESILIGLLFQLILFSNSSLLILTGRLIPETIMILPLLLICLMVIKNVDSNNTSGYISDMVLYGLIIGFGIAYKLSFIPVILIPLIILKTSFGKKLKFLGYTILFTALFAYPIVFNISTFWEWISEVAGESSRHDINRSFIDLSLIPENFKTLFNFDKTFFFIMLFSLLLNFLFSTRTFKNKGLYHSNTVRSIFAVNITIILCIALILKRFALHYFMPFYVFKYLLIILSAVLIARLQIIIKLCQFKTIVFVLFSILAISISFGQIEKTKSTIERLIERKELQQQKLCMITSLIKPDSPIIISGKYSGTPFIEFAHHSDYMMTYHLKGYFKDYLMEKFPKTFQYVAWSDKFYFWDNYVDFNHILKKTEDTFYVYIGKGKKKDLAEIEKRISKSEIKDIVSTKVLYENTTEDEMLIEFHINSGKDQY